MSAIEEMEMLKERTLERLNEVKIETKVEEKKEESLAERLPPKPVEIKRSEPIPIPNGDDYITIKRDEYNEMVNNINKRKVKKELKNFRDGKAYREDYCKVKKLGRELDISFNGSIPELVDKICEVLMLSGKEYTKKEKMNCVLEYIERMRKEERIRENEISIAK